MAEIITKIRLPKRSGKWLKVIEKSVNFVSDNIEWQPCCTVRQRSLTWASTVCLDLKF